MAVDAGSIYSAVRIKLDQLKGDVKSVESLLDQIGSSSEKNAKQTQDSFESAFDATQLAGVAAFAAITLAMKQSIKVAGDYEQSIANVQSVVMGSAETFDMLNAKAKHAGETTRFTASQAADSLYNLAQGGLTAAEAIDALDGVLMLAGATQSGLSEAAALTVATLNQYGLAASEASRISNVFAASISSSMATMTKLQAGMRQAGPVASALGLSLEETVAALNAMYDAGFQGEQAGTALRSMLAFLASEADPTTRKLMELGLTFEQLNPAANSFADIIDNISRSGITAGQVMDAFGTRAGAQMLTLLRNGKRGLEEYEAAITGTNTAAEMYAIQNDTLRGSLERLKSAAESAQIEFVEKFTPAMRIFLEILTQITIVVARMPGPLKIFFGILLAGIPTVLALTKAFTALSAAVAAASGPIGWVVAGVAAAAAGFSTLNTKLKDMETKRTEEEFGALAKELNMTAKELKALTKAAKELDMSVDDYQELVASLELSKAGAAILSTVIRETRMSFQSIIPYVDRWAEVLDISYESMVRILLASDALKDSDREILNGVIEKIEAEKALIEVEKEGAKTEEEHMLELKRNRVADHNQRMAGMKAELKEQQKLFDIYEATLAEIDRKQRLGVVTEKEALEEKKKASDKLISALLEQETIWTSNEFAIKAAVATGKEYADGVKEIEDAEKAAKDAADEHKKMIEDLAEEQQRAKEQLEEIGATEIELAEIHRGRRLAIIDAMDVDKEAKKAATDSVNAYYDAYILMLEAQKKLAEDKIIETKMAAQKELAESYKRKLEDLNAAEIEAIELQRKRAIDGAEGNEDLIVSINAYYDALRDTTAESEAIKKTQKMARDIKKIWDGLSNSLASLFSALYDDKLDSLERELQAELEAAGLADKSAKEQAEKALEDAKKKNDEEISLIEKRLEAALNAGDEESALLLRQQAEDVRAAHQEIELEKQKAIDKAAVEEDYEEKRKQIQFEAAMVSWRIQMAQAVADAAMLSLSGFLTKPFIPAGLVAGGLATAQGAMQVAAVTMAKPKLATGGIVLPKAGGTEVTLAENEYAEMALNAGPSGQALIGMFAKQIVSHMQGNTGGGTTVINLQVDRKTLSTIVVDDINNGRVRLNR